MSPSLVNRCLAEVIGTFILVFFGCGAVHAAVLMNAHSGLWQVAIVWGVAIMVAVYVVGGISGAHINPAITLALAVWGRFSPGLVLPYIVSQLAGAALAAAALFALYHPFLEARERDRNIQRGERGSEITAMCYGEYFPNPGPVSTNEKLKDAAVRLKLEELERQFGVWPAVFAEFLGTLILALVVFALTDERNTAAPLSRLAPVFIGLTVAILISVIAPLTQACFNPARDFGPRIVAYFAGWGKVAFPGPRQDILSVLSIPLDVLSVYLFAPLLGAVAGGGLYTWLLQRALAGPGKGEAS